MDSISRLRDNAFLVRRTQTARPFRGFWSDRFVRCEKKGKKKQDLHTFAPLQSQDFFSRASDERSYQKLEKVGPFECDELEKHCRVSAKCYPTKLPALYTMAKEQFSSFFCPTVEKSIAGDELLPIKETCPRCISFHVYIWKIENGKRTEHQSDKN